jgi:hypothetical protein
LLLGPGRAVWILATLLSVGRAALTASRLPSPVPLASLALLMLLPTVSFVAFNTVLSPQFHLWLLPWCAIVLAVGDLPGFDARLARRAAWCIVVATMIVPVFYPHRSYSSGLDVGRTATLLFRNVLLVYASVCLWLSAQRAFPIKIKA